MGTKLEGMISNVLPTSRLIIRVHRRSSPSRCLQSDRKQQPGNLRYPICEKCRTSSRTPHFAVFNRLIRPNSPRAPWAVILHNYLLAASIRSCFYRCKERIVLYPVCEVLKSILAGSSCPFYLLHISSSNKAGMKRTQLAQLRHVLYISFSFVNETAFTGINIIVFSLLLSSYFVL